jgi:hypothetical protein
MDYAGKIETVAAEYVPRMMAKLAEVMRELVDSGFEVDGPYDTTSDDFRCELFATGNGLGETVSVSLEIAESIEYDGTEDGVSFVLDIVAEGGEIIGGLTPYNYSPEVWVSLADHEAINVRWAIIDQAPVSDIAYLIEQYRDRKGIA